MEKTNWPDKRQAPDAGPPATEMKVNPFEQERTEQSESVDTAWSKPRPGDRADSPDELGQLRDHEKELVERIADVDNDMRTTAFRLQRALQTQRRETDRRLRRHAWLLGGLALFALLLAVALFLVYRQFGLESPRVAAGVSEIRRESADFSEERAIHTQVPERPERVTTQNAESAPAPGEPDRDNGQEQVSPATEQTSGEQAEDRGSGELPRLDAGQGKPVRDPESPRSAAPQSLAAGSSATPMAAASMSTADESSTQDTGRVPEKTEGDQPAEKTPKADGGEVPAATAPIAASTSIADETGGAQDGGKGDQPAEKTGPKADGGEAPTTTAPIAASTSIADETGGAQDAGRASDEGKGNQPAEGTDPETDGGDPASKAAAAGAADLDKTHIVPAGSYVLQLIGYSDRKSLNKFVARKGLPAQVYVIHQTYKRRSWHSVIHSLHASFAAAKAELSRLPADLAALKPWIRSLPEGTELRAVKTGPK